MRKLKSEGKLTVRITEWLPFAAPLERLEQMRKDGGTTDPWLRTGALKMVTRWRARFPHRRHARALFRRRKNIRNPHHGSGKIKDARNRTRQGRLPTKFPRHR